MPSDQELPPAPVQPEQPGQTVTPEIHGGLPPDPLEGTASRHADTLEKPLDSEVAEPQPDYGHVPMAQPDLSPHVMSETAPTPATPAESPVTRINVVEHQDESDPVAAPATSQHWEMPSVEGDSEPEKPSATQSVGTPEAGSLVGTSFMDKMTDHEPTAGSDEPSGPTVQRGAIGEGQPLTEHVNVEQSTEASQGSFDQEAVRREFERRWIPKLEANPPSEAYKKAMGFDMDIGTAEGFTAMGLEAYELAKKFDSIRFDPSKVHEALQLLDEMKKRINVMGDIESGKASDPNFI